MSSKSSSSSSPFSSSSSSMMSSDMSSMMGGMPPMRGMQMPQMGGFDMPGLSFREMPDMPLPSGGGGPQAQPEYTVTSPPMSPPPEMNHKVQKTEDYVPPSTSQTAEAAVHGEKFNQKHIIPDNINLDAMSSSFPSDGV